MSTEIKKPFEPDTISRRVQHGVIRFAKQETLCGDAPVKSDIVLTPRSVSKKIVEHFNPSGLCLDPCRGDGAFYDYLPDPKEYCEIREGVDFFDYNKRVDWIISNPPYSIFAKFLDHSFVVAKNIVYLIPLNKPFNSYLIMKKIYEYGGIKEIFVVSNGAALNFPIGFLIGAVHFQENYTGQIKTTFMDV